ncbi:MAG: type ISP restriction/modification enzyme [Salinarimonas sp.]
MSQMLIQNYLAELDRLRRFSGANSEQIIREAFKDLLKGYARAQHLIFVPELEYETGMKRKVYPDGSILHELRVAHGFWEAKDEADDLDTEIERKLRRGYPQSNIIFENSETAVLIQDRQEVMRCAMRDVDALAALLERFFAWERPEIAEFRAAVAQFKRDLPAVLHALRGKINAAYAANAPFATAAAAFLQQARETINPAVSEADIKEMLIQHILTEEIFGHVFNEGDFHRENNIAKALYDLEAEFFTGAVKRDTLRALEPYYAAIRANAAQITGHHEKQSFLKAIYENFYKVYNPKAADRLGVVYTPNEIVRFMIEGADWLCREHFGRALIDEGVEILDPATGTGTFICEMLEHFRGQPEKLIRKYKQELHANEVAILPYYVANLNIEATCYGITGQWAEFPNLCFVDTLDNTAALTARKGQQHDLFGGMSQENVARIKRQNERKISVVIGNPPYNAWQESFNLRNPNRLYRIIDESLRDTYVRRGSAQNKNALYDMYVRFYRWASDRLAEDGIVAFITNRNFIAKAAFDGFRKSVAEEFAEIYVVDLGGDVRENPKLSGTKHNVFGIQTGVAIAFLVKHPRRQQCRVHYAARPEYDTAEDKLAWLQTTRANMVNYRRIEPDERGNWLNQTNNDWDALLPLCSKEGKAARAGREETLFHLFSRGLGTYRDEWVYDFSRETLEEKVRYLVATYEATRKDPDYPQRDTIKWDRELEKYLNNDTRKNYQSDQCIASQFRPFVKNYVYFDRHFNGMTYQLGAVFPSKNAANSVIAFLGIASSHEIAVLGSATIFDLGLLKQGNGGTQGLPRYRYTPDGTRIDNITDWGLSQFIKHYGKKPGGRELSKDAIFAYVYGVLHDPIYRATYAQNLKRDFPRIPFQKDFWLWADWGRRLLDLHIFYAEQDPWLVKRSDLPDERARAAGVAPKPILRAEPEDGVIRIDSETTLSDIPREAFDYKLGNRSGLAWILDQYKEKTPRDPTIREKFNTYRFADYKEHVVDLITRVTRVSVETVAITRAMEAASSVKREG